MYIYSYYLFVGGVGCSLSVLLCSIFVITVSLVMYFIQLNLLNHKEMISVVKRKYDPSLKINSRPTEFHW